MPSRDSKPKVSIVKTKREPGQAEISAAVRESLLLIGGIESLISPGQLVLINPNWALSIVKREEAVITLPEVAKAVADVVIELGGRAVIAESSAVGIDSEKVIRSSGYNDLRRQGYQVIDLKKRPKVTIPVKDGLVLKELETYDLVQQADLIISLPKLKTHDHAELTCALKNLKGLVHDDYKRRFHWEFGLYDAIIDTISTLNPALAVVDAIVCQEGLGPMFGRPVELDLIVAGRDLVAVDSVCGRIAGFDPEEVPITPRAAKAGLGVCEINKINVVGESVEAVGKRFLRASEVNPIEVEGFDLIAGQATCTGCRTTTMIALKHMEVGNMLDYLKDVVVIAGKDLAAPKGVNPNRVVSVGKCIPKNKRIGYYVPGCPPSMVRIVDRIVKITDKDKRIIARLNRKTEEFALVFEEQATGSPEELIIWRAE